MLDIMSQHHLVEDLATAEADESGYLRMMKSGGDFVLLTSRPTQALAY
jgi:hypothetical protein